MCATALLVHIQICIAFVSSGSMATRTSAEFFFAGGATCTARNIPKQNIIGKQAQNYVTAIMQCYYSDDKSLFGYFNLFGRFSFL